MTDTQTPERVWIKEAYDSWGAYGHWYEDATGGGHEFVNADLYAAVVAERDQLEEAVNELLIVWQNDGSVNDLDLVKLHAAIKAIETSRTELEKHDG